MSTPEATVAHENPSDRPTDQIPRAAAPHATEPTSAASRPAASDKMRNAVIAGGIGVAVVAAGLGFGAGYVVGDSSSSNQGPGMNMPGGGMNGQMPGGQGGMNGQMPGGQGSTGQMPGGQGGMGGQMPGGQQGQMPGQQGQTPGQTAPGNGSSAQSGQSTGA